MSWEDTSAFKTLVETVTILADRTSLATVDKPVSGQPPVPLPYAVIFPSDGIDESLRLTAPSVTTHPEFVVHLVGKSVEQVQALGDLVKSVCVVGGFGVVVDVSGRRNQKLRYRSPLPIQVDNNVSPALVFMVVEVDWRSDPT